MYEDNINSTIQSTIPPDTTDNLDGDLTYEEKAQVAQAVAMADEAWVVEAGDNLGSIAKDMGVPLESLVLHNNITNPNSINVGQVINKPPPVTEYAPLYYDNTQGQYLDDLNSFRAQPAIDAYTRNLIEF